MFDQAAEALFRKDASGRLIFVPRGPRKAGYYIHAPSDEQKIKAMVKLQIASVMLFNLAGFLGCNALAITWESAVFHPSPCFD